MCGGPFPAVYVDSTETKAGEDEDGGEGGWARGAARQSGPPPGSSSQFVISQRMVPPPCTAINQPTNPQPHTGHVPYVGMFTPSRDYSLLSELGRGGNGVVFLGQSADDSTQFRAIKVCKNVPYNRQEYLVTMNLDHPNVVKVRTASMYITVDIIVELSSDTLLVSLY